MWQWTISENDLFYEKLKFFKLHISDITLFNS